MYNAINILSVARSFPGYVRRASTQEAVVLPLIIGFLLLKLGPKKPLSREHGLVFLFGLMLSVVFSIHQQTSGVGALYAIPGYALIIQFLPVDKQPSWPAAFVLSFFNLLLTDLWCCASWHLVHDALPGNFYYGVGGAGWHDLLFIGPWLAAIPLMLRDVLTRLGIADKTIIECASAIKRQFAKAA